MPMPCCEGGLEEPDDLAVHVIDSRGGEEHGADGPAHAPHPCAGREFRCLLCCDYFQFRLVIILPLQLIRLFHQSVCQLLRNFKRFVFLQPVFGDQPRQE